MLDTFVCLIYSAQDHPSNAANLNTFSVVIFLKFILFTSLIMRWLTKLWRLGRPELNEINTEEDVLRLR